VTGNHDSIELMNFYLSEDLMKNKDKNPDNIIYNTIYDGTINMNSVLMA